jgi:hypothetical protein
LQARLWLPFLTGSARMGGSFLSLKTFHIVFMVLASALTALFGLWALREYNRSSEGGGYLAMVIGAGLCFVLLLVYGKWFLHKIKDNKLT